jgi:hypothetical protein
VRHLTALDLARDPEEVARSLPAWDRGDHDDAVRETLALSKKHLHDRAYVAWTWAGSTTDACPAWILPVSTQQVRDLAPRAPARVLMRSLHAAVEAGAVPGGITVLDWHGLAVLTLPGLDDDITGLAVQEAHPEPARGVLATLPGDVRPDGPEVVLAGPPARMDPDDPLTPLASATWAHPVRVALVLAAHGQAMHAPSHPPAIVGELRRWGLDGSPPPPDAPSLEVEDDPCPRRRHARTVLRRLLRMGKVGAQYHTEFENLYRGAAPEDRSDALAVGEALVRAGILGEKPSVGQRHVYLRRDALPAIHALIDRGETRDVLLAAEWTAAAPGAR